MCIVRLRLQALFLWGVGQTHQAEALSVACISIICKHDKKDRCVIMKKKYRVITVGQVNFKVLYGNLLPTVKTDEYERLKASIKEAGVLVPVLTDENRGVIDGKHRLQAASELNLKTVPFNILYGLDDQTKKHLAIKLNAQRRQMTKDERLSMATDLRKDGLSLRQIADILNVGHATVSRILVLCPG